MKKLIFSFLSMLTLTSSAIANNASWNQHLGSYAELNGGTNLFYLGVLSSKGNTTGAGVLGLGWSTALGYNISPSFGLEAGFMQNYADINDGDHINVPYASTRFTIPVSDRVHFIGKLGAGYLVVPGQSDLLVPYTGVGFGYAATSDLDFTVQYQGMVYGVAGAGLLSFGITYHF